MERLTARVCEITGKEEYKTTYCLLIIIKKTLLIFIEVNKRNIGEEIGEVDTSVTSQNKVNIAEGFRRGWKADCMKRNKNYRPESSHGNHFLLDFFLSSFVLSFL